jgi:hypothetical protein
MRRPLRRAEGAALLVLPLAAFFVGPILGMFDTGISGVVLYSYLPTFLTLAAAIVVFGFVFSRTGSAKRAAAFCAGSLAIAFLGAVAYLLAAWPTGS